MRQRTARYLLFLGALIWTVALTSCGKDESEEIIIEYGTLSDIENNQYVTVKIGDQWWMAENLRTSKFNDGTPLTYIGIEEEDTVWSSNQEVAYAYINDSILGYLYNGKVVMSDKNIAPEGWHIATDEDWKKLEETIGIPDSELDQTGWRGEDEGEKLVSKYSAGWPEGGLIFGSDAYGFNALPGGCRIHDGRTNVSGNTAFWWTKSDTDNELWYRYIDINNRKIFRQHILKQYGMSIRCVKD